MVHTAYALHLTAAHAAQLCDDSAKRAKEPGRVDYTLEAKKWKAVSEDAFNVVQHWESPQAPANRRKPQGNKSKTSPACGLGGVGTAVQRLLLASANLQGALSLAPAPMRSRISSVIDEIDLAIREIPFDGSPGC